MSKTDVNSRLTLDNALRRKKLKTKEDADNIREFGYPVRVKYRSDIFVLSLVTRSAMANKPGKGTHLGVSKIKEAVTSSRQSRY